LEEFDAEREGERENFNGFDLVNGLK